jgi:hypothetical protein
MKVAIKDKMPEIGGFFFGNIAVYDFDKEKDFEAFCNDLMTIGSFHEQRKVKIVLENGHEFEY